jgi:type IV pilus assembly protein PilO
MRGFQLKKRIIFAGLAVLLLADSIFAYYILKMSNPLYNPQQVLAVQARDLALLRADVKRASGIRDKIPDVLKAFDQFEGALPPGNKGYSVISQELGGFAKDTHLLIEDERFRQKEVAGRNLIELELEATVTGDYTSIVRFLNDLQRSKNVYIIDSLELDSQASTQGAPGSLRVNLHVRTYFRKV